MSIRALKRVAKDIALHGIANAKELMGANSKFGIRGAYKHRSEYCYFDDTGLADEYQKEVYLRAAELAADEGAKTIYDVGCGSGFKLVNYLGQYDTTGFD